MRALTTRYTSARWAAAWVWLLLGLTAAGWGWRVWGHVGFEPLPLPPFELSQPDSGQIALVLGHGAVPEAPAASLSATPDASIRLVGLARDNHGHGVALLAVSNQAAAAFRVGAMVTDVWQLVTLNPDGAELAHIGQADQRRTIPVE